MAEDSVEDLFDRGWLTPLLDHRKSKEDATARERALLLERLEHQNAELKESLELTKEELRRQEELLEELSTRNEAENTMLAAQLHSLHQAKAELCQEKQRLEQENEFLLMERWLMFEQLGIDPESEQCSLLQALSQQMHVAQQGLEAVGHLQRLGLQLQRLAQHDHVTSLHEPPRPQLSWASSRSLSQLSFSGTTMSTTGPGTTTTTQPPLSASTKPGSPAPPFMSGPLRSLSPGPATTSQLRMSGRKSPPVLLATELASLDTSMFLSQCTAAPLSPQCDRPLGIAHALDQEGAESSPGAAWEPDFTQHCLGADQEALDALCAYTDIDSWAQDTSSNSSGGGGGAPPDFCSWNSTPSEPGMPGSSLDAALVMMQLSEPVGRVGSGSGRVVLTGRRA